MTNGSERIPEREENPDKQEHRAPFVHTVTITRVPDESGDDYEYTFGGEHGRDCQVFVQCKRKACQAMNPNYEPFEERFRHGKEHFYRDGDWLVESDLCALRYVFEHTTEWETFDGLPVGTFPVRIEWEDTWWLEVQNPVVPPDEENRAG